MIRSVTPAFCGRPSQYPSNAVSSVVATGWFQYSENAYLVVFFAAGVVLVCLMLRT